MLRREFLGKLAALVGGLQLPLLSWQAGKSLAEATRPPARVVVEWHKGWPITWVYDRHGNQIRYAYRVEHTPPTDGRPARLAVHRYALKTDGDFSGSFSTPSGQLPTEICLFYGDIEFDFRGVPCPGDPAKLPFTIIPSEINWTHA